MEIVRKSAKLYSAEQWLDFLLSIYTDVEHIGTDEDRDEYVFKCY